MGYTLGLPAGTCCGCGSPDGMTAVSINVVSVPCEDNLLNISHEVNTTAVAVQENRACSLLKEGDDCPARLAVTAISATGSYTLATTSVIDSCVVLGPCFDGVNTLTDDYDTTLTSVTASVTTAGLISIWGTFTGTRAQTDTGCPGIGDMCASPPIPDDPCTATSSNTAVTVSWGSSAGPALQLQMRCQTTTPGCDTQFRVYRGVPQFLPSDCVSEAEQACVNECTGTVTDNPYDAGNPLQNAETPAATGDATATLTVIVRSADGGTIYNETITAKNYYGGNAAQCCLPPTWWYYSRSQTNYTESNASPAGCYFATSDYSLDVFFQATVEITLGAVV